MKIAKLLMVIALLFLVQTASYAAQNNKENSAYTLPGYIALYIQNSPDIVRNFTALESAKLEFRNNFMGSFLPEARFNAGTTLLSKETPGVHIDNPYTTGLYIDWNIFNNGRDYLTYRRQKNLLDIAQIKFDNALQDITLKAIDIFYDLNLKQSLLQVAQRDLKEKNEQYQTTQSRYKYGLTPYTDLLQDENALKNSQLRMAQATADYDNSRNVFNDSIGRDIEAEVKLDFELPSTPKPYQGHYSADLEKAVINRQDINTGILSLHNQKIAQRLTLLDNLPTLNAAFNLSNTNSDVFGDNSNKTNYALGVYLNVPIGFFWLDKYNNVQISKLDLVNSFMDFEDMYRSIKREVSQGLTNLNLQYQGILISENNLKIARERLRIITAKYNEGKEYAATLAQAQDEYLNTQINDTTYKYNYQLALYVYQRTLGLPIYQMSEITLDTKKFVSEKEDFIKNNFLTR